LQVSFKDKNKETHHTFSNTQKAARFYFIHHI